MNLQMLEVDTSRKVQTLHIKQGSESERVTTIEMDGTAADFGAFVPFNRVFSGIYLVQRCTPTGKHILTTFDKTIEIHLIAINLTTH